MFSFKLFVLAIVFDVGEIVVEHPRDYSFAIVLLTSAGSIGSPHILQVSGIGDSHKLKNLGIKIVYD